MREYFENWKSILFQAANRNGPVFKRPMITRIIETLSTTEKF